MNYQTIFTGTRASSYQQAMATFPMARESEFRNLFNNFPLTTNETVLDVPSGGGYLGYFYPTNSIKSLEFTGGFNPDIDTVDIDSEWNIGCHDRAVCLAATHHIEDFRTFISNLVQCVYPSGIIHIADVESNSRISLFLDEFVNQYNPLGHKGIYRDFSDALWPTTLKLLSINKRPCPWVFSDIENMIYFCTNLFGLKECPDGVLLEALMDYIGYEKVNDKLVLNWELVYTDLIRK